MRSSRYNFREAETRWQKTWEDRKVFETKTDDPRPIYYVLEMFPYPSGRIHMGHGRNYTMGEVLARYMPMRGHNVLHPMGWDAFGLPAERYAMQTGVHPRAASNFLHCLLRGDQYWAERARAAAAVARFRGAGYAKHKRHLIAGPKPYVDVLGLEN